jgi:hypothetical protein
MSYIPFKLFCNQCFYIWMTAVGVVNTTVYEPDTKCPNCGSDNISTYKERPTPILQ